ncbi:hypothetical protein Adt_03427 [Abeliophyllum distichum]|uniref:Uncharacterized protein n=1 Tax=Abeliophyllum distichum TaxID=126358 RepID=A0ABD1VYH8_9LAMI
MTPTITTPTKSEVYGFTRKRDVLLAFYHNYWLCPTHSLELHLDLLDRIIDMLRKSHPKLHDEVKIRRLCETIPDFWALVINEIVQWSDNDLSYEDVTYLLHESYDASRDLQ